MTIMAGATIAPSLPQMEKVFSGADHAAFLSRLILTIPALFIAFLSPLAGYIIDNYGRRQTLIYSLVLYALSGTSGLYLTNIYAILAGRALLGVAVAGTMTTTITLAGDFFEGMERRRFMGYLGSFMGIGGVVFIFLGGVLADVQWRLPFALYLFSILILFMVIRFIEEPHSRQNRAPSFNFKYLKQTPALVLLIYFVAFAGFLFFYITPMEIPFILNSRTSVSNTTVGISLSISILMGSIISYQYALIRKFVSYRGIYALTFFLMAVGYAIISFAEVYAVFLIGLILQGLGTGLLMPNSNLWLINISPAGIRGRMIGNLSFFVYMGQFLSPVFFNPIAEYAGPQGGFGIIGIFMMLIAAIFFISQVKKASKGETF